MLKQGEALSSSVDVVNPYTGETDRSYSYLTFEEAHARIADLRSAQQAWALLPLSERLSLVTQALRYFEVNREQVAQDISSQMGRPLHQARGEINGLLERGHYMCKISEQVLAPESFSDMPGYDRSIHHAPYGVIYVISAWNYPLLITVNSVVPALLAGNTVLLKHATQTTEIGCHFESAFAQVFNDVAPMPVLSSVVIPHAVSEKVIRKGLIDHVIFTGSVSAGQKILAQCAEPLIAPNLELGGKDAVYVDQSADIQVAAETIVDGACFNAGQSCCGIERAYVHQAVYEEFLLAARQLMEQYRLGDPQSPDTTMGPLAIAQNADVMRNQVMQAKNAGARCLVGGETEVIGRATFFQPTLLADVPQDIDAVRIENFGPILAVAPVSDVCEAISKINDSNLGLSSAIFTSNVMQAEQYFEHVQAGTIFLNRCDYLDPALPWTGFKQSGCGSALSRFGFYSVTQRKSKHFRLPKS